MPLSWNEIKRRALEFSQEWAGEDSEKSEAQSFWNDFFNVFGIKRRRLTTFEHAVKKHNGNTGAIDLFWEGTLIVEHKSRGKNLDKAFDQATDYFHGLEEAQLPRYILISDFAKFRLYDLESNEQPFKEFTLEKLIENVELFGFIAGYQKRIYREQDPVNIKAAEKMGQLHDQLKEIGYIGHQLEVYLVRLLFCLFADGGGIFEKGIFVEYLSNQTKEDGSDLAARLDELFQVLNTPQAKRFKNIDESLDAFPFVNGKLFEERLSTASFDTKMRSLLLKSSSLDWGQISPAIFGALFQSVMNGSERRKTGAHYTSEKNILKVIKPLFLNELWLEFEQAKGNRRSLDMFHEKLRHFRFIDPACGCGNFLIVAYRELRLLELEILKQLYKVGDAQLLDIGNILLVSVDQFYGIEYTEFPSQIAQVAMWLIDHQMNMVVSQTFGQYFVRLPLDKAANIVHGNALELNWLNVLKLESDAQALTHLFILGNPPWLGKSNQSASQRLELKKVFNDAKGVGDLDYVTGWFIKASQLMQRLNQSHPKIKSKTAFVSTNSITQGEQVPVLWSLLAATKIIIHFAHRTFKWSNEAKNKAGVHCVIIGFAVWDVQDKLIYDYETVSGEPHESKATLITPYLVNFNRQILIQKAQSPICDVPLMRSGNKPTDDGNFIFETEATKNKFISSEPASEEFIRLYLGSEELINGTQRWCLWLEDAKPDELKKMPMVTDRIAKVRQSRLKSTAKPTQQAAETPTRFFYTSQPKSRFIAIPEVSSESRTYIPIAILDQNIIASNKLYTIPNDSLYIFGILSSLMHMAWVSHISGRLKSDYQYSGSMVYNTFPFPKNVDPKKEKVVEQSTQKVLDARALYPTSTLADLYDPNTMPNELTKAHRELNKAVDACYGKRIFKTEISRMEFLFELYDLYTSGFLATKKIKALKKPKS